MKFMVLQALGNPSEDTCIHLEEGMARLAFEQDFPKTVTPLHTSI